MKKFGSVMKDALKTMRPANLKAVPEDFYHCKLCMDRGLIYNGDIATRCSCTKQQSSFKGFSPFGKALQEASFENFDFKYYLEHSDDHQIPERESAVKAFRAAKEFVLSIIKGEIPKGVMLIGNVGSGKTHLAAAMANVLMLSGIKTTFVVVPDLLDELRSTFKNEEVTENEVLDIAKKAPVLVLDDLGAHNYTDWTRNKLFSLINYRLTHLLPTIITTNLDMGELEEYLGERTTSRIVELCKIYRLNVQRDIRFQKSMKR